MLHFLLEMLGIVFVGLWEFGDKLLRSLWACVPTFVELKQTFAYVSTEGIIALCAGVPLGLVSLVSWGIKKLIKEK